MKTFKTNREPVSFNESQEYFNIFKQVFAKVMGIYLSRDRRWREGDLLCTFTKRDDQAYMSMVFFMNFTVKLLEKTELDPKTYSTDISSLNVRYLPQRFTDKVFSYFGAMKVEELVAANKEQVDDTEQSGLAESRDIKSLMILSALGQILEKLDSIPDEATLYEMVQQSKLNDLIRQIYINVEISLCGEPDVLSENFQINEQELNIILFDLSHYTKKQIVETAKNITQN